MNLPGARHLAPQFPVLTGSSASPLRKQAPGQANGRGWSAKRRPSPSGRSPLGVRATGSWKETPIPPNECLQTDRQALEIRMSSVDDDIALHARDDRWDDQDRTSVSGIPFPPEAPGCFRIRLEPFRYRVGRCDLIAGSLWNRYLDEMPVRRQNSVPVHQHFQHCGRIGLGSVDYCSPSLMPPSRDPFGAFGAPHRELPRRVADPIGTHRLREFSRHRQGATPASARRMRFNTASAPAELDRAMSKGVSPSNNGCARFRNLSIASQSP